MGETKFTLNNSSYCSQISENEGARAQKSLFWYIDWLIDWGKLVFKPHFWDCAKKIVLSLFVFNYKKYRAFGKKNSLNPLNYQGPEYFFYPLTTDKLSLL